MLKLLEDPSRPRLQMLLIAAILLVMCFISYGPAIDAPINWDDAEWLTENAAVAHSDPSWIWTHHRSTASFYPLTLTSFWIEYHIWGLWLPGYRIVNILLHTMSGLMLWSILRKLKAPGAALAAIVWAVHPIQAETVVWISERKNTLSGVFFFAGLLTWLKFFEPQARKAIKILAYAATVILLICALLAKGATVFFPVAALGLAWYYAGRLHKNHILASIPLFLLAAYMALVTMRFEHLLAASGYGKEWDLTFVQRLILAGHCFWFYIGKMLWPDELAFIYTRWQLNAGNPGEYVPFVSAVLLMAGTFFLALRKKIHGPFIAMGIYLAGIFPVIGFFKFFTQIYTYVADHYAYLASAAFITLAVALIVAGWKAFRTYAPGLKLPGWLAPATCLILVFALTVLSCGQSLLYRSFLAVWEETLRITPTAWVAHNAVGQYKFETLNQPAEALAHFEEGLKANRDSRLLTNAGLALERLGQPQKARAYYKEAIDNNVRHFTAYIRAAFFEFQDKNFQAAIEICQKGLEINPYQPTLWAILGDAYRQNNQLEEATRAYVRCLELNPNARNVRLVLGDIAYEQEKYEQAVHWYAQAEAQDPNNPRVRFNYAGALRKLGRDQEAQTQQAAGNEMVARYNAATQARAATQPATATAPAATQRAGS